MVVIISKWKVIGKFICFLVLGIVWNFVVIIEDFVYCEEGGDVEIIYFDLLLREYKFVMIWKLDEKKIVVNGSKKVIISIMVVCLSIKMVLVMYKVKFGDFLWKIVKVNNIIW